MNHRVRVIFLLAVCSTGCSETGPVQILEREGLVIDAGSSHQLALTWQGLVVPTEGYEPEVALTRSDDGGIAAMRFRRSYRPAGNGGQYQQMSFERTELGSTTPSVEVPFLPTTWCDPAKACPTSYYADVIDPKVLSDRSVLMAVRLGSATPPTAFEPSQRLLRFSFDGGVLLNVGIEMDKLAPQAVVTALNDGTFVVSYSRGAGYSSEGVTIELRSPESGGIVSTLGIDSTEIADSGVGIRATAHPSVTRLVPTRSGGFLAVGQVSMTRGIACGSQDSPRPGGCGQGTSHAMLVKVDQNGRQLWRRDLGQTYEQPGSYFVDAAELPDGSIVATGHIERGTNDWLQPLHGTLVTRFSADGAIQNATRFCPCTPFTSGGGYAQASNPRASGNGGYEIMFRDGKGIATAARFNAVNELVAAEVLPRQGQLQLFITTESGWAFFYPQKTELRHVEFVPR